MYVEYSYYESGYLLGRDSVVPEKEFSYWEKQAECVMNANCNLITDQVRDCTCELAELLYRADKSAQREAEQGGPLQSYSNDGESGTFDLSQSVYTETGMQKKIREILYRHLGNTGLMYAGV